MLEPGTVVPKPKGDRSWLIQKHKESINDFEDIDPNEKEYAIEWTGFIIYQNVTSDDALPRAWLNFVKEKAPWLVERQARMEEFSKHMIYLVARDALDEESTRRALEHIRVARTRKAQQDDQADSQPKPVQPVRHKDVCAMCVKPVRGFDTLVCANEVSFHQRFHPRPRESSSDESLTLDRLHEGEEGRLQVCAPPLGMRSQDSQDGRQEQGLDLQRLPRAAREPAADGAGLGGAALTAAYAGESRRCRTDIR